LGRRSEAESAESEADIALLLILEIKVVVESFRAHCRKNPHLAESASNSLKNHDRYEPQCAAFNLAITRWCVGDLARHLFLPA
jgi:hypothetical protein